MCGVKLFMDGVFGSCGVVLLVDYSDDLYNCGLLVMLLADFEMVVCKVDGCGL